MDALAGNRACMRPRDGLLRRCRFQKSESRNGHRNEDCCTSSRLGVDMPPKTGINTSKASLRLAATSLTFSTRAYNVRHDLPPGPAHLTGPAEHQLSVCSRTSVN